MTSGSAVRDGSPGSRANRRVRLVWWVLAFTASLFMPSPFGFMPAASIFLWGLVGDRTIATSGTAERDRRIGGLLALYTLAGYTILRRVVEPLLFRRPESARQD